MNRILPLALLAASSGALAQTPPPAAAPVATPAAITIAPANCPKPTLPPVNKELSNKESEKLNSDNKAFQTCIRSYVNARNAEIDEHNAAAKANAAAANVANTALNAYVVEFNAYAEARAKASEE